MEDLVLCSSGLAPSRQDAVSRMVGFMGGTFKKDFVQSTTHLICDKPCSSAKYKVALTTKVTPVVTSQWVQDMWTKQQSLDWTKYRLPPFLNLHFGAFGLAHQQRDFIMNLVTKNGGHWVTSLERHMTYLCVVDSSAAQGDAAVFKAVSFGTKLVCPQWVERCVNMGGLLEGGELDVNVGNATTPPEGKSVAPLFVAILSPDCPPDAPLWVRQCGGQVTDRAREATVVISPLILPPDSPLLTIGRPATTVHPDWLHESKEAGQLLAMDRFPPRLGRTTPASHGTRRGGGGAGTTTGLFSGHTFSVVGFDSHRCDELTRSIIEQGGRVISWSSADFVVLMDGAQAPANVPATCLVSTSWLKATIAGQKAADRNHFASLPFAFATPLEAMRGLCVSITGFDDLERTLLMDVVERLGATYCERLDKRETTHLVCHSATGPKYDAVVKKGWQVNLVSLDWLRRISTLGAVPDATDFPVLAKMATAHSMGEEAMRALTMTPLKELTVFFSRSIPTALRKTCVEVAQLLGASVVTAWETEVTHYVHQGKITQRDSVPSRGVAVVSPAWIFECQKQGTRVSEAQFPCTLNPKRNLVSAVEVVEDTGTTSLVKREKKRGAALPLLDDLQSVAVTPINNTKASSKKSKVETAAKQEHPLRPAGVAAGAELELAPTPIALASQRTSSNEFQKELAGLIGELKSIGIPKNATFERPAPSSLGPSSRSSSASSSSATSSNRNLLNTSNGALVTPLLRRAELKGGSNAAADFLSGGDGEDAPIVTYRDDAQIRKQQRILETTKSRANGDLRARDDDDPAGAAAAAAGGSPPSTTKRGRSSSSASLELSLSLESMSESKSKRKRPRNFCMSKVDNTTRKAQLTQMIEDLGGTVDDAVVPGQTTYLLLGELSRTPKFLEATCLGLWVVRPEYVEACSKAGRWIDEESYEWSSQYVIQLAADGHGPAKGKLEDLAKLAEAPRAHRLRLQQHHHSHKRLLSGVRCLFLGAPSKCAPYLKCLELLGGSSVYCGNTPDWDVLGAADVSHAFVDADYRLSRADSSALGTLPVLQAEWVIQCVVQARLLGSHEYRVIQRK